MSHLFKSRPRNSAFTLVEILIVIAIIGVLVSLVSVGVMTALEKGKSVAARTEISQLESAIAAAKQNFGGVDNLPSAIKLHSRADLLMADTSRIAIDTRNFLTKVFGKAWIPLPNPTTLVYSSTPTMYWMGPGYTGTYPVTFYGMEALVYWLGGVRDGSLTFQGFSSNPSTPWDTTNIKLKALFTNLILLECLTIIQLPSQLLSIAGMVLMLIFLVLIIQIFLEQLMVAMALTRQLVVQFPLC